MPLHQHYFQPGKPAYALLGVILVLIACGVGSTFGQQRQAPSEVAQLKQAIEQRKLLIPTPPDYLYSADTITGAISAVWIDVTGGVLGTRDLRNKYDEFYFAAHGYRSMAARAISRAGRALERGDVQGAGNYIGEFDRYQKLFTLSNKGAIAAYEGNSTAASTFAGGIYKGSKAAVKFGSRFVLGPTGSRLVDQGYDALDFLVDIPELGVNQAAKQALTNKLIDVVFEELPIEKLDGKTISQFLEKSTTKMIGSSGLYGLLDDVFHSPEFEKAFMKVLAEGGKTLVNGQAKALVSEMLGDMTIGGKWAPGSATQPSPTGPENEPHTFDGEWLSPEFGYGFRVQGLTGIAIQSNSPTFKPGDVILRFKSTGTNTFSGEQICTDGKFYPVTGTLRSDGVLAMTVQGCSPPTWNMLRKPSGLANATLNRSWYSPEWKYGVAIKGNTGIITQSNLPNMKVGDTSLKITANANNSFDGEHLCTDGKFHPMHGTLGYDGRLYLTVPECTPGIIYLLPVGALATDSPTGPETPSPEAAPKPSSAIQSAACSEPVIQPGMSGKDAALVLGPVKESDRNSAIAAMVRGGKLRNPLCAEEVALILKGTTQVYRANSIAVLVPVIKSQLSGKEAAMILGSAQECAESNRYSAIAALAEGKRIKSSLVGEEIEMILDGTTGVYRSTAIGVLSAK